MSGHEKGAHLYKLLCILFDKINPPSLDLGDKQRGIQHMKRTFRTAFKTLLASQGESVPNEDVLLQYYRFIYGLRSGMKYDSANGVENCLESVQGESFSDAGPVLHLLLKLENISHTLKGNTITTAKPKTLLRGGVSEFPQQTLIYGTTDVTRAFFPFSYPQYQKESFHADVHLLLESSSLMKSADGLSRLPDITELDSKHRGLFGALRVVPKSLNFLGVSSASNFDLEIPKLSLQEPQTFAVPFHSPAGSDEGYGSSVASPVPAREVRGGTKLPEKQQTEALWDDIDILLSDSRVRKTWDSSAVSCFSYAEPEKPYLTEAPLTIMPAVCQVIRNNLNLLNPRRENNPASHITESAFVRNLIHLVQGVETEIFQYSKIPQKFFVKHKVTVPGLSEEVLTESLDPVLEMGSLSRCLHQLPMNDVPSFTGRAFCIQLGQLVQFQQRVLIDFLEKEKKVTLEFVQRVRKLVPTTRKLFGYAQRCCGGKQDDGWAVIFLEELINQISVSCSQEERSLLIAIFCATTRPFLKFLEKWIFEGVCCDPHHEFVIQVSPEFLPERERSYWTESFALRPAILTAGRPSSQGLTSLFADVLLCGKTVNLIKLCHSKYNPGSGIPLRLYLDLETLGRAEQLCRDYEEEHVIKKKKSAEKVEDIAQTAGKIREANLLDLEESNRVKRQAAALHKEQQQKLMRDQLDQQVEEKRKEREKQTEKEKKEEEKRQKIQNDTLRKEMEARRKLLDRYAQLLSNDPIQSTEDAINANDESIDEEGNILPGVFMETVAERLQYNPVAPSVKTTAPDVPDSTQVPITVNSDQIDPIEECPPCESAPEPKEEQQVEIPANPVKLELKTKLLQSFEVSDWLNDIQIDQLEISTLSLSYFVEQSLQQPLRAQIRVANSALLHYFLQEEQFVHHLEFLRDFLFLNDGSFSRSLVSDIASRLFRASRLWQVVNIPTMNSILNESLDNSVRKDDPLKGNLSFFINDIASDQPVDMDSINVLSCFSLRFRVHWPHNLILTEALMDDYSSIFTLILQLKLSSWTLGQIFRHDKLSGRTNYEIQVYRQGMQHFVQALEFYVGHQLLKVTWNELVQDLENKVASLDDFYDVHCRYIQRALSRLLMTPSASSVMKIVKEAMDLVLRFGRIVGHVEGSCSESVMAELKGIYEKFQHCAKLLYMVLEKIESKSHQAHLSNLLLVLNFNDYYI